MKVSTLYTDYQSILIDLRIYGTRLLAPQPDIDSFKAELFEEFKAIKPLPTLEQSRYELGRAVKRDSKIVRGRDVVLKSNEETVDLRKRSKRVSEDRKEIKPVADNIRMMFAYGIHDRDREEIIRKYDLYTGEPFSRGINETERIQGSVVQDRNIFVENPGVVEEDNDRVVWEDFPADDETTLLEREDLFDTGGIEITLGSDETAGGGMEESEDIEIESEGFEDDFESEFEDIYDDYSDEEEFESEDLENGFSEDFEDIYNDYSDEEESESEEVSNDSNNEGASGDNNSEDLEDEFLDNFEDDYTDYENEPEFEDNVLEDTKDDFEEDVYDDSDGETEDFEDEYIEEEFEDFEDEYTEEEFEDSEEYESSSVEGEIPEEAIGGDSKVSEVGLQRSKNVEGGANYESGETSHEEVSGGQETGVDSEDDFDISDMFEKPNTTQYPVGTQSRVQESKPEVGVVVAEPTDLREFLRKYPNSEYDFVRKYFTKKQIDTAIKIGKIMKRGTKLRRT